MSVKAGLNGLTEAIIGAAVEVHRHSGPGLLEQAAVIVEVKSIGKLERVHSAQLLSYLRFAQRPVGLLFSFNVGWLTREGLQRVVNEFQE